jgi:hypothetical protein
MRFTKEHIIKSQKKAKLIYDLFSTGNYTVDDLIYKYVLPEEYWVNIDDETGTPIIVLTMNPTQTMKLYTSIRKPDGSLTHPTPVEKEYRHLHNDAKDRVKKKFARFNIDIIF